MQESNNLVLTFVHKHPLFVGCTISYFLYNAYMFVLIRLRVSSHLYVMHVHQENHSGAWAASASKRHYQSRPLNVFLCARVCVYTYICLVYIFACMYVGLYMIVRVHIFINASANA